MTDEERVYVRERRLDHPVFDVEPRDALMQEFGIDRALMWPTRSSVIEQAVPDDPRAVQVVFQALNQWM